MKPDTLITNAVWKIERGPLVFSVAGVSVMFLLGLYFAGWIGNETAASSRQSFSAGSMAAYLPVWIGESVFAVMLWRQIWQTQDAAHAAVGKDKHVAQAFLLIVWLGLDLLMVIAGGGVLAHMDAPWAQMSAASISPAHLMTFIAVMPAYIVFGVSSWLFARTRLPEFAKGNLGHFLIVTFAPFMFLPAFDPQDLIHSLNPNSDLYLVLYWMITITWIANVGWLLAKLFRYVLLQFPEMKQKRH